MSSRDLLALWLQTFSEWNQDKASRLAAALAYYALFSLAPLLVVLTFTVGLAFGQQAAQGQLVTRLEGIVGPDAAEMIQGMIEVAGRQRSGGVLASVVGLGALGLFGALQDALNTIWGVQKRRSAGVLAGIGAQLFNRLTSFAVVLLVGLLLIVAFVLSVRSRRWPPGSATPCPGPPTVGLWPTWLSRSPSSPRSSPSSTRCCRTWRWPGAMSGLGL